MKKKLLIALLFGAIGTTTEIFFTAGSTILTSIKQHTTIDWTLKGESYVWMFFIYSLIAPLFNFGYPKVKNLNIFLRIFIYAVIILFVEFIMGFLLNLLIGKCPWEYTTGITICSYIRLDYIFFWMGFGFIIEKLYLLLNNTISIKP
jgi:hypothetical protein